MSVQNFLTRPQCDDCHHLMSLRRVERWRSDGHAHCKYVWQCARCTAVKFERT